MPRIDARSTRLHSGAGGAVSIHQDARVYLSTIDGGQQVSHTLAADRHAWLQILRGAASLNGHELKTGDGAAVSDEQRLTIEAHGGAEVMLFDLA